MLRIFYCTFLAAIPLIGFSQKSIDTELEASIDSLLLRGDHFRKVERDVKSAIKIYNQAFDLSLQNFGSESLEFAHSSYRMGLGYNKIEPLKSLYHFDLASKAFKKLGDSYLDFRIKSLYNCGFLSFNDSNFEQSLAYVLEVIDLKKDVSGVQNKAMKICYDILIAQNKYDDCLELFESKKQYNVFRQNFDFNIHYATLLNNINKYDEANFHASLIEKHFLNVDGFQKFYRYRRLSTLFKALNKYSKAEYYFLECEELSDDLEFDSRSKLASLARHKINYANYCFRTGSFKKSEKIFLELINSSLAKYFSSEINMALYENLSVLYVHLGATEKARYYLNEFYKGKNGKLVGKETMAYWANIATVYSMEQSYEAAKNALQNAIDYSVNLANRDNKMDIRLFSSMAEICLKLNQSEESRKYIDKAIHILGESSNQSEVFAYTYKVLSDVLFNEKDITSAQLNLDLAFNSLGEKEAKNYAKVKPILKSYIKIFTSQEDYESAAKYCKDLAECSIEEITRQYSYLPSDSREKYLERIAYDEISTIQSYATLIGGQAMHDLQARLSLFIKGLQLKTNTDFNEFISESKDPFVIELQDTIDFLKSQTDLNQEELIQLYTLQRKLQEESSKRNIKSIKKQSDIKYVQNLLNRREAYIQFVQYTDLDQMEAMIGASIINSKGPVYFVPLCKKADIESQLQIDEILAGNYRGIKVTKVEQAQKLYEYIWSPLMPILAKKKDIYYSSTGVLNFLNLGVLKEQDQPVYKVFNLLMISSVASLDDRDKELTDKNNSGLLVGGVNYDSDNGRSNAYEPIWPYLSSSSLEVGQIELSLGSSFKLQKLDGFSASEKNFYKSLEGENAPRFLHLATHGHYQPQIKDEISDEFNSNAMFNSCLVFSGANNLGKDFQSYEKENDGIVSAAELADLNLRGTELVVLSSCNSGLGDFSSFEGMFGLARGLKLAGTKYVIMTLSPVVDDIQLVEFVKEFYAQWLLKGKDIPEAFNKTQEKMDLLFGTENQLTNFILYK
jgi:CHAT domain-containing protein